MTSRSEAGSALVRETLHVVWVHMARLILL